VIQLPPYFSFQASAQLQSVNYRANGLNVIKAEQMLNESIMSTCCSSQGGGCNLGAGSFEVVRMQRLENPDIFRQFKQYESTVATENPALCPNTTPDVHEWLTKLAQKNELSAAANTHYLLHGTDAVQIDSIARNGLKLQYSNPGGLFGQGLYFTDSSCKAKHYGDGSPSGARGCILIYRVVLGNVMKLDRDCRGRLAPPSGYHSLMAATNRTRRPIGNTVFPLQLHNEYIAFDDCACYPEFALTVDFG
jgi:hypothetical protein